MMKTLRAACSVILCLSLLFSGTFTSVYAVGDTAAIATEPHAHIHSADPAPIADTAAVRTLYNKGGITVKIELFSEHFGSSNGAYICEAPDNIYITSSNGNITGVDFYTAEWAKGQSATDYYLAKKDLIQGCTLNGLGTQSVAAKIASGSLGNIIIAISCNGAETDVTFAISHVLGGRESAQYDPSCTQRARREVHYICRICNIVYDIDAIYDKNTEPTGHIFEETVVDNSCEGTPVVYNKCVKCGFMELKEGSFINKEIHNFTVEMYNAPTCYAEGVTYRKCAACDVVDPESFNSINSLAHAFTRPNDPTNEVIPPNCEEWGKIIRRCQNPGCTAYVESLNGSPLGHNWQLIGGYKVAPTCGQDGIGDVQCQRCMSIEYDHVFPSTGGHNYSVYETIKEPTCTETGLANYFCANCGEERGENQRITLPMLNHVAESDDNDCTTPVLCVNCRTVLKEGNESHDFSSTRYSTDGTQHWKVCSVAGCSKTSTPEPHVRPSSEVQDCSKPFNCQVCNTRVNSSPHQFKEGEYISDNLYHALTCTICGVQMKSMHTYINSRGTCLEDIKCTVCGHVHFPAKTSHNFVQWVDTQDGIHHESDCANAYCDVIETDVHHFGDPDVVTERSASCEEDGLNILVYTCTDCGYKKSEEQVIKAAGHSYGDWIVEQASTCQAEGRKYKECSVCHETVYDSEPIGDHIWSETPTIDQQPTCTDEGSESIRCTICNTVKESKIIPMLQHDYDMTTPLEHSLAPNCVDSGINYFACKNCGAETAVEVPKLGHTFGEYVYNEDADCQKAGTKTRSCEICTLKETVEDPDHPKTGHSFSDYIYQNDATIDHDGTEVAFCDYGCGTTDTRTVPDTQLHQHTFTTYYIVTEATCTTNAFEQAKCDICGTPSEIREMEGSALGHVGGAPAVVTPATCTEGAFMTISCERCGLVLESGVDENSVLGHSFTNYVYNNDATVDEDGTETAVCDRGCGAVDTRTKPGTKLESEHVFTHYVYNNDATCTNGTETAYCDNGCGTTHTREAVGTALGHAYGDPIIVTLATCTEPATVKYVCTRCGTETETTTQGDALGHSYGDPVITPATCTEPATVKYVCDRCGVETEPTVQGTALGHSYGAPVVVIPATCTEPEMVKTVCTRCGAETEPVKHGEPLGHDYGDPIVVKSATCTDDEVVKYVCSRCKDEYEETLADTAKGHEYGDPVVVTPATCTEPEIVKTVCTRCGAETEPVKHGEPLGHDYGDPIVVTPATCTDDEVVKYVCSRCKDEYEETLADTAKGHDYGDPVVVTPATCTEPETVKTVCTRCGAETEPVEHGEPLGHDYGDPAVVTPATCTEPETVKTVCTRCGAETEPVKHGEPLGHDYGDPVVVTPATCTEPETVKTVCTRCGAETEPVEHGEPLGHDYGDPVVVTPATCTEPETVKTVCTRCGAETEPVEHGEPLGHDYGDPAVVTPATCTEPETVKTVCTRCGAETEPVEHGEPLGHDYGDPVVVTPATCTEPETVKTVCTRCGAETEPVKHGEPLGHDYGDPVVVTPATCTEDEVVKYVCSRCKDEYEETLEGTAKGHVSDDGTVTKKPTVTEYGEKTYKCVVCGVVLRVESIDPLEHGGDVHADAVSGDGAPEVSIDSKAFADAVLTPEDKQAIAEGDNIDIVLSIDDISATVTDSDKELTASVSDGYVVGRYLDINLTKYINGVESKIDKTNSAVRIVIEIPDDLLSAYNRVYKIVKIHNGVPELLDDLDDVRNTITFETSEFSTYAIVMKNVVTPFVHNHAFAGWSSDSLYHWMQCVTCGMNIGYEPHTFVNGVCSRCGLISHVYVPDTESGEEVIEVDVATEGGFGESDFDD